MMGVGPVAARPAGDREGQAWWATDTDTLSIWDGAAWQALSKDAEVWRRVGVNNVEGTTTSVVLVNLISVAGLSIPATSWIRVNLLARKTAGAANFAFCLLRLNTVEDVNPQLTGRPFTSVDRAEIGTYQWLIAPRDANYDQSGMLFTAQVPAAGATAGGEITLPIGAAVGWPATVTDVIIRGRVLDALITLGAIRLTVEELPTV